MQPHLQQTREQATGEDVVLLVQDTTDIDVSHRRKISGVGHIGNERGRGFFVQTVLAVRPRTREVLGCMAQEPFVRIHAHAGEQRYQRRKREERETDVWIRQVQTIGTPESGSMWGACGVHVGCMWGACRRPSCGYVPVLPGVSLDADAFSGPSGPKSTRAAGRRRDQLFADAAPACLWADDALATARTRREQARIQSRCGSSASGKSRHEMGEEPLEWILATSVPTTTLEQAWERVEWYRHRWLVEDYHHCLKSGCRIEERQGPRVDGLMRRLGSVVASGRAAVRRCVPALVKTQSVQLTR